MTEVIQLTMEQVLEKHGEIPDDQWAAQVKAVVEATPLLKGTTGVSYTEKVRVALASVEVVPPDLFDPLCDALDIPIARTSPVVRIIGKKVFGLNSE